MKTIIKTVLYLQMIALLLTTALAGPEAAEEEKHFHGRVNALEWREGASIFPAKRVE